MASSIANLVFRSRCHCSMPDLLAPIQSLFQGTATLIDVQRALHDGANPNVCKVPLLLANRDSTPCALVSTHRRKYWLVAQRRGH
eukprot:1352789-Amphidinium_carterae.1